MNWAGASDFECNGLHGTIQFGGDRQYPACNVFITLHLAFPYDNHTPTQGPKRLVAGSIAFDVPLKFRAPVLQIGFRHSAGAAISMLVPEASSHLDSQSLFGEDNVRFPGKVTAANPETHPGAV